jgi:Tfp pilus assembly PilM family ATPase
MARAVGIDLTESSVRLVWLDPNSKRGTLLAYHEAPVPPGAEVPWEERAAAALKAAFAESKIPRGRAVAALDSGDAILREVSLPFKNDEQIRKTVRFEMESLIHNYTIEQLVVSHFKTGETDKGSHLLAAAVPKAVVGKRLKVVQDAGVDPVALDLDISAVFNAMNHAGAIDTDEPHLLIHGTSKFTKLVFVEQRRPRSIRTIRFSLPAPGRSAEERARAGEETQDGEIIPIVVLDEEQSKRFSDLDLDTQSALVEILAKEISRFLLANAASASPSHILLSGDFEDEHAAQMLEAATQIPVRTFNLLEAFDHPFKKPDPDKSSRIGVALGLALKGAGVDALGLDFRQEEFQYRKKFEAVKTTALVTVELVIVFLAAVALHLHFKRSDFRRAADFVLGHHQELYESVSPETLADKAQAYPKLQELFRKLPASVDMPLKVSARQVWRDLFAALQEFQRKYGNQTLGDGPLFVELESLDIAQVTNPGNESLTVTLIGKARNLQFAEAMKNEIRNSPSELFRNAEVGSFVNVEGGVRFTLKATRKGA